MVDDVAVQSSDTGMMSRMSSVAASRKSFFDAAWTIGQIVFDDEPLSSVVERVNRYGGTRIVIADPAVGAMKISGVFNAGDVVGFVGIVTHYLPVKAVSSDSSTIALESTAKKNRAL